MTDPYESRMARVVGVLLVVVPALLLLAFLIGFRAVLLISQGDSLWLAVGKASLLVIGALGFAVLVWWVARVSRR